MNPQPFTYGMDKAPYGEINPSGAGNGSHFAFAQPLKYLNYLLKAI